MGEGRKKSLIGIKKVCVGMCSSPSTISAYMQHTIILPFIISIIIINKYFTDWINI